MQDSVICTKVIELLEDGTFILLSSLGLEIRNLIEPGQKLKNILSSCDNLLILQDPQIKARIAICKAEDVSAKELFFGTIASKQPLKEEIKTHESNIIKSLIHAFSKTLTAGQKLLILNKYPYKFQVTNDNDNIPVNYLHVDEKFLGSTDIDSIINNIYRWAEENAISKHDLEYNPKEHKAKNFNSHKELLKFIDAQPIEIQNKIVFPASFVKLFIK